MPVIPAAIELVVEDPVVAAAVVDAAVVPFALAEAVAANFSDPDVTATFRKASATSVPVNVIVPVGDGGGGTPLPTPMLVVQTAAFALGFPHPFTALGMAGFPAPAVVNVQAQDRLMLSP